MLCFSLLKSYNPVISFWVPFKTFPSHILHSACIVTSHGFYSMDKYHQLLTGSIRWVIKFSFVLIKFILCFLHFRTSWTKVFGKHCKGYVIIAGIRHATPIFGEIDKVLVLYGREVLLNYTAPRLPPPQPPGVATRYRDTYI